MRTLAVIPACEGSVVFPNKNMRVVNGKPIIYYAINNAIHANCINDIIVTSNSNEILSLAKQMGTMIRNRRPELCNISASLDEVVWDVFEQLSINDYDYVVTMLPISPTLRYETLDAAFRRMIYENRDTMISVHNQANFYWKYEDGKAIPMQQKRMNRNQLEPFFIETGAFLITRASCIASDTRIGNNVGLYELSGDEAIDVNNFGDLKLAENALTGRKVAIYVNGNEEIGLGHIVRTKEIADELFSKPDFYYDINKTKPESFGNTTYNLIPVNGDMELVEKVAFENYDIIINDILDTSEFYIKSLRDKTSSIIINFEDKGKGARYADIVFNALYEDSDFNNVVSGSQYYIISKLFLIYNPIIIKDKVKNVLVTFGGADPSNYSEKLLDLALKSKYDSLQFYVVLGKVNDKIEFIDERYNKKNIKILRNIDNMPEIMSKCDISVTSRGRTCFELAALGVPSLSIAQHEREMLHTFVCQENGFICLDPDSSIDEIEQAFDSLVSLSMENRLACQQRMLLHDLRNGRTNVIDYILKYNGKKRIFFEEDLQT